MYFGTPAAVSSLATSPISASPARTRALRVVLVGPRIAEISEHAIAHVLGDKPTGAFDDLGDRAMVGADYLAQILGVEPGRQRGRADQSQNMIVN
jgi:hypothetical protein